MEKHSGRDSAHGWVTRGRGSAHGGAEQGAGDPCMEGRNKGQGIRVWLGGTRGRGSVYGGAEQGAGVGRLFWQSTVWRQYKGIRQVVSHGGREF